MARLMLGAERERKKVNLRLAADLVEEILHDRFFFAQLRAGRRKLLLGKSTELDPLNHRAGAVSVAGQRNANVQAL